MIDNIGKFMDEHGLTFEEQIYYANEAEIERCDLCNEYFGIHNFHDNAANIEYNGVQFLCSKCRS